MIDRKQFLIAGLGAAAWLLLPGHTPYRQWVVYRRRYLLIGTCRADEPSYPLGKEIAAVLAEQVPESKARVTRAPDQWRLASLITTGQIDVILLSRTDVVALRDGAPPFEAFGATELAALFRFGDHILVCRPDFPDLHAWLIADGLSRGAEAFADAGPAVAVSVPVPVHTGAALFAAGAPEPEPPADVEVPADHAHDE